LAGKAKSTAEKGLAGNYASDVQGVKDVFNHITAEYAKDQLTQIADS
jgi:osmotically-inducible protein OsmY